MRTIAILAALAGCPSPTKGEHSTTHGTDTVDTVDTDTGPAGDTATNPSTATGTGTWQGTCSASGIYTYPTGSGTVTFSAGTIYEITMTLTEDAGAIVGDAQFTIEADFTQGTFTYTNTDTGSWQLAGSRNSDRIDLAVTSATDTSTVDPSGPTTVSTGFVLTQSGDHLEGSATQTFVVPPDDTYTTTYSASGTYACAFDR